MCDRMTIIIDKDYVASNLIWTEKRIVWYTVIVANEMTEIKWGDEGKRKRQWNVSFVQCRYSVCVMLKGDNEKWLWEIFLR